ncbi:WRKY DNA-binding transcription factor 70-like [Impatiens glandulifera]|uniref:WRKY DNA-binding transcription factor 70-like n=1 Tax=Impatiens glandulifera TaxID=253017 RepID=UPI001FB17A4A|nr:WRKY DNA-binding transcription factor 70-like [Impatiens glandulifera]
MESPLMEKATKELIIGRENLTKLITLIEDPSNIITDLVAGISRSFEYSIRILNSGGQSGDGISEETVDRKSVDSIQSNKRPAARDRRGCYKRKKISDSSSLSPTMEDGYTWRKYGQKFIHSHKFPRCYFRCTHKSDGCTAIKQVQISEEDHSLFQTTYFGQHTCSNKTKSSYESIPLTNDPYIANFDSIATPTSEEMDHPLDDKSCVIKEGGKELPELIDAMAWSDLVTFESSEMMFKAGFEEDVSSIYNFDYGDLSSGFGVNIDNVNLFLN